MYMSDNKSANEKLKNNKKKVVILLLVLVIIASLYFLISNITMSKYKTFESDNIVYTVDKNEDYILFTMPGASNCSEEIKLVKNKIDSDNNLNLYFDFKYKCGLCGEEDEIFKIPTKGKTINEVKAYYRVKSIENCNQNISYKPIMYIYPTEEMDLTVKLKNSKLLTHTYPKYNDAWNIHVKTNGEIYDYNTNRSYYALYWEAIDNTKINTNEGFVVEGKNTIKFLEDKLEYLGLNKMEINEFIVYWIDKLENNKYNYIRFRNTNEVNNYMPLEFSKKPDTLIRIIMDYKPLKEKINVKEQVLERNTRSGFTVVEWGGRKIK